jgi:hypothetical protein
MINRQALLIDLQKFLQRIEVDLLERSESTEVPEVPAALHAEYEKAAKAERTAQNYEDWRTDTITQAAAAWVLSCVFVRFLEDNSLIDTPKIAGPGERLARARDEHELYFRSYPQHTDREYLLSIFGELAELPGAKGIFGEHNAINDLPNWLSGDAAGELLNFFQKIDASTGELVHDFTDPNWDTRFLGDLYQDLSESARKKFALLQTPDFVEELILDRTLDPAIEEFGLVPQPSGNQETSSTRFKMIDPACGSGHFLLGAFPRLLDRWQRKEPGTNIRELTQRALDSIHGVDINPFAVAIAKFRLLLVAMKACNIRRLADAPAFHIRVACGDSLLHGENRSFTGQSWMEFAEGATDQELYSHAYPGENLQTVRTLLRRGEYHCIVANPPYIVANDAKLSDWYKKRFRACHKQYSLAVPFMELIFLLGKDGAFSGQITANSFMNNEFGEKLVVSILPRFDLTHVIDTRYLQPPGHATPTVIILGRSRSPMQDVVRIAMGIKGETPAPKDLRTGGVWTSILSQIDSCHAQDAYFSISDVPRNKLSIHPWSLGGGGAASLKEKICRASCSKLGKMTLAIGRTTHTGKNPAFVLANSSGHRHGFGEHTIDFVSGEDIRDFEILPQARVIFPYDKDSAKPIDSFPASLKQHFWRMRTVLKSRIDFGQTIEERGLRWIDHSMFFPARLLATSTIAFAFKSTHNHFVIESEKRVFNQHAPAILLDDNYKSIAYGLFAILNSSTAAFWEREVHRQVSGAGEERWEGRLERNATKYDDFPVANNLPVEKGELLAQLARRRSTLKPSRLLTSYSGRSEEIKKAAIEYESITRQLIALQEDIDWECYNYYGLATDAVRENGLACGENSCVRISVGERAFEIVLARKIAAGDLETNWFERHGSTPITELPAAWPESYKRLVQRRIEIIESNSDIRLIEQPEFKRRWNAESWESQLKQALRDWLILRLETFFDFDGRMSEITHTKNAFFPLAEIAMYSVSQVADVARRDPQFMHVGELYRDDTAFDVHALVEELVHAESVPHLPILRYKESGLRKRFEWEKTWDLQRREDAGESIGKIPIPPEFGSVDFVGLTNSRFWALRGKLDVPQERWISFPHCEGPDGTPVICWAGYDYLQQAQAISAYYVRVQTEFGGSDDPRLIPLLASLIELLPWIKQWHNEPNANFDGLRMGDYFEGFVNEEAHNLGKTLYEIKAWVPPKKVAARRKLKATSSKALDRPSSS